MEMFRKGPFGHLIDIQIKKCHGQLLVHLMRRMSKQSTDDTLIFNLEGNIAKFGLREFHLISRLNCQPFPQSTTSNIKEEFNSELRTVCFSIIDTLDRNKIISAFSIAQLSDQLMVKLANLLILDCFINCKQLHNVVDWKHLKMVDEEETLLNFPWGRLPFNLTVEYMRKAIENLTVNFSLQGFPHILVCWALEIIPKLSESPNGIATRIGHRSPRIINWKLEQQPVWTYLQPNYFKSSDISSFSSMS